MRPYLRCFSFLMVWVIVVSQLTACGWSGEETPTATPSAAATQTIMVAPTSSAEGDGGEANGAQVEGRETASETSGPANTLPTIDMSDEAVAERAAELDFELVGTSGGLITGPNDATIEVPEGSIDQTVGLSLTTDAVVPEPESDVELLGATYTVVAEQQVALLADFIVTVPFPENLPSGVSSDDLLAIYYDGVSWTPLTPAVAIAPTRGFLSLAAQEEASFVEFSLSKLQGSVAWVMREAWDKIAAPDLTSDPWVTLSRNSADVVFVTLRDKEIAADGTVVADVVLKNNKAFPLHGVGRVVEGSAQDSGTTLVVSVLDGDYFLLWPKHETVIKQVTFAPGSKLELQISPSGRDVLETLSLLFAIVATPAWIIVSGNYPPTVGILDVFDSVEDLKALQRIATDVTRSSTDAAQAADKFGEGDWIGGTSELIEAMSELSAKDMEPFVEFMSKRLGVSVSPDLLRQGFKKVANAGIDRIAGVAFFTADLVAAVSWEAVDPPYGATAIISIPGRTTSATEESSPTTSGVDLAYVSPEGDLWVSAVDGSNARKIVDGQISDPFWSRDGNRIAYVRTVQPTDSGVWGDQIEVANADGSDAVVLVPPRDDPSLVPEVEGYKGFHNLRWAPDDSALYYAYGIALRGGRGIIRHELRTGVEEDIGVPEVILGSGFDVATDGTLAAFGNPYNADRFTHHLYLIPEVGAPQLLHKMSGEDSFPSPAWSPDATQIALQLDDGLELIGRDGTELRRVADGPVGDIAWSPDGTTLAYVTPSSNGSESGGIVWTVPPPGGLPIERFAGSAPTWRSIAPSDWQKVTWEGFTISYPPGHTFRETPELRLRPPMRAAASILPTDCIPMSDCQGIGLSLFTNDDGRSAEEWVRENRAYAHNLKEVTVADQPGIFFEEADPPDDMFNRGSAFAVPIGKEMLEIGGGNYYRSVVEQVVASMSRSTSSDAALLPAEYVGTWKSRDGDAAITLTLELGEVGSVIGESLFTFTFFCRYTLTLLEVHETHIVVRESLAKGGARCFAHSPAALQQVDEQTLSWQSTDDSSSAAFTLTRVTASDGSAQLPIDGRLAIRLIV